MIYEISERKNAPGEWGVERIGGDGEVYMAIFSGPEAKERAENYAKIEAENAELRGVLDMPETRDFVEGAVKEAGHQRKRWGEDHDANKTDEDWLWVIAYLTTKATQAFRYGDHEKGLHYIITTAAACSNWHRRREGQREVKDAE